MSRLGQARSGYAGAEGEHQQADTGDADGRVPSATRSVKITIIAIGDLGAHSDGYADNVSLILTR